MKRIAAAGATLLVTILATPAPASADVTAFLGFSPTPETRPTRGFAVGMNFLIVGFEFEYANTREKETQLAPGLVTNMFNGLISTPTTGFQFYGTAGAGFYRERFGELTETSFGIIPGAGGTQRLPRLIGETRAKELIFTAKKIDAMTAERYGLATAVVAREALMTTCLEFANQMLQNGPIALRQAKRAIDQGRDVSLEQGLQLETEAYEVVIPTADRQEALQAFAEKRPPRFEGR